MLIIIGYVVKDGEDRYLAWSQRLGYSYKRTYQITPHIFNREKDAIHHAEAWPASGVEVKPIYIEAWADDPTDRISPEAARANNI